MGGRPGTLASGEPVVPSSRPAITSPTSTAAPVPGAAPGPATAVKPPMGKPAVLPIGPVREEVAKVDGAPEPAILGGEAPAPAPAVAAALDRLVDAVKDQQEGESVVDNPSEPEPAPEPQVEEAAPVQEEAPQEPAGQQLTPAQQALKDSLFGR